MLHSATVLNERNLRPVLGVLAPIMWPPLVAFADFQRAKSVGRAGHAMSSLKDCADYSAVATEVGIALTGRWGHMRSRFMTVISRSQLLLLTEDPL